MKKLSLLLVLALLVGCLLTACLLPASAQEIPHPFCNKICKKEGKVK